MLSSLQLTTAITRYAVTTSSSGRTCYNVRRTVSSLSSSHRRSCSSTTCAFSSTPQRLLFCIDVTTSRRRMFTSSCILLDSRLTGKDDNVTGAESCSAKQTNDSSAEVATSSPMNQRAAGEILTQLTSVPNLLTLSRIAATPYLSYLLITHHHTKQASDYIVAESVATNMDPSSIPVYALSLFLAMGFTDFLDGFIARKFPSTATVLGTYLDPFADKVFISTLSLTLWYTETLPGTLVGLWIARDVGVFLGAYYLVKQETLKRIDSDRTKNVAIMDPRNTPLKVEASLLSKVNTTLQIGLIALGIAGEVPGVSIDADLMTSLCWVTAGATVGSTIGYLGGSAFRKSGNE